VDGVKQLIQKAKNIYGNLNIVALML